MKEMLKIRCTACGAENDYEREMIVKADDLPLKNSLLNGTFFTFECKGCGKLVSAAAPILYFDQAHRYMILMTCGRDTKEIDGAAKSLPKEFRLRKTDSLPGLQEMIYAIDSGLDPRLVELLKKAVRTAMKQRKFAIREIFFSGIEDSKDKGKRLVFYCAADQPDTRGMNSALPFSYYDRAKELFADKLTETDSFMQYDEAWAETFSTEHFPAVPEPEEEEHDHSCNCCDDECSCHDDECSCHDN